MNQPSSLKLMMLFGEHLLRAEPEWLTPEDRESLQVFLNFANVRVLELKQSIGPREQKLIEACRFVKGFLREVEKRPIPDHLRSVQARVHGELYAKLDEALAPFDN